MIFMIKILEFNVGDSINFQPYLLSQRSSDDNTNYFNSKVQYAGVSQDRSEIYSFGKFIKYGSS